MAALSSDGEPLPRLNETRVALPSGPMSTDSSTTPSSRRRSESAGYGGGG
jgi:hypothetical protein